MSEPSEWALERARKALRKPYSTSAEDVESVARALDAAPPPGTEGQDG